MKRIAVLLVVLLLLSACGTKTAQEASAAASVPESFGAEAPAGTETALADAKAALSKLEDGQIKDALQSGLPS